MGRGGPGHKAPPPLGPAQGERDKGVPELPAPILTRAAAGMDPAGLDGGGHRGGESSPHSQQPFR